ncbi:MAG: putative secreted protein [Pseudobdellovibrio sp.]|jgi:hypothetical protein|nr:putative secreted protein [Pseudobdellovibrio sp.]
MNFSKVIFSLTVLSLYSPLAAAKSMWTPRFDPPPFTIQVQVLRMFGDGCPAGTARAAITPDQSTISILFDNFVNEIPPTSVPVQAKKTCSVTLGIKFPGQNRVAIVGSDARGFAHVPAGGVASFAVNHHSIYGTPKHAQKMSIKREIRGPSEGPVEINSRFQDLPLWSQCGTQMKYNTQIFPFMTITMELSGSSQDPQDSLMTAMDSLDFSAPLSYHVAWTPDTKNCPK